MPQDILTAMNDHIDARVNSQVQLALRGTQTDILTLRNAQDNQGASIKRLTTAQTQLETDLQDNTKMLMEATADVLKQGETLTSILKITADLETRSKAQAATVAKLAAKLQMMGKRQATAMSDSIEDPEVAPPPTTRAAHE
jgi:septal ring factor EnvC (AmiA/AmiB activator)